MRRRDLLASTAALLAGLAGCSGDGGADTPEPTPESTPTATATQSPTPSATPDATSTPTPGGADTPDPATPTDPGGSATATTTGTPTPSPTPDVAQVVEVAPDASLSFGPETFEVAAGETVRWTWEAGGHNVRAESTPADSDWDGTPGGDGTTYDEGYTYEYTFDVPGEYEYVCIPHESLGMTGSFTVTE